MIKIEKTEFAGFEAAIRGMRNPLNSWEKSDTIVGCVENGPDVIIGENDLDLMSRLRNAGTEHRKYMRMMVVSCDITAPMYWWKEFDTYKVGTVANSCSTMHKIHSKPIEFSDFSIDDCEIESEHVCISLADCFLNVITDCEGLRRKYLETGDKRYWKGLIQLLPMSYNQLRTVMLNYEVLANIYRSRKNHKLTEWHTFCDWIKILPYSELIIGDK